MHSTIEKAASERLQTLYRVNDMLKQIEADGLQMNVVLPRVLDLAAEQLNATDGSIIVVNDDFEAEYSWLSNVNTGEEMDPDFLKAILHHGLAGTVIHTKEPALINDTSADTRWLPFPSSAHSEIWSVISTPFLVRDRAIGAITVHKLGVEQFEPNDLDLLNAISNQAASTIENARLFARTEQQLRIADLMYNASLLINSSLDINEIMGRLLQQMNEFLHAEAVSIALVDYSTNELVYESAIGKGATDIIGLRLPSNHGLSGWVMEHSEPVRVNDTTNDRRFSTQADERTGSNTYAMICAPMQYKNRVLGTIQAINPLDGTFTETDLRLLINLANIASSAIANAQQYARTQEAEARYVSLFQDSVDPIILTDMRGNIVEANRRALAFLGYGRHELLQRTIYDLHPTTIRLPNPEKLKTEEVRVFNSQLCDSSNTMTHVEVYTRRTIFGDTELIQWIHHDISKHVELEEMRADLTAMLFHDLQSPLGNVISSLELLSYEVPEGDESPMHIMLDIATRSSQRLQTLVRSLLDINQLEAGKPLKEETIASTDLQTLINEVAEIEAPNLEKRRIQLVPDLPADLPSVYIDSDMIRRVLLNLVDNAMKYSSQSKLITVSAVLLPETDQVQVSVSDQGDGIPPQYRKSIFEKFQRIKPKNSSSKGLGLGLAFCRLAVEAHNGRIWIDDAPGGGARFNFTLPATPVQPAA